MLIFSNATLTLIFQFQQELVCSMQQHGMSDIILTNPIKFRPIYARLALVATEMRCSAIDCVTQYAAIVKARTAAQVAAARSFLPTPVPVARPPFVPRPIAPAPAPTFTSVLSISAELAHASQALLQPSSPATSVQVPLPDPASTGHTGVSDSTLQSERVCASK